MPGVTALPATLSTSVRSTPKRTNPARVSSIRPLFRRMAIPVFQEPPRATRPNAAPGISAVLGEPTLPLAAISGPVGSMRGRTPVKGPAALSRFSEFEPFAPVRSFFLNNHLRPVPEIGSISESARCSGMSSSFCPALARRLEHHVLKLSAYPPLVRVLLFWLGTDPPGSWFPSSPAAVSHCRLGCCA